MKLAPFCSFIALFALTLSGCATAQSRWAKADVLTRNNFLIRQHLAACIARGDPFPVYAFGVKEVDLYYEKYPELKAARQEFTEANEALIAVLEQDGRYRELQEWYHQLPAAEKRAAVETLKHRRTHEVYDRLQQTSEPYRIARAKRDQALYRSDAITIDRMLADCTLSGRALPVDWMGEETIARYIAKF